MSVYVAPPPFKGWLVRGHIAQGTENTRYPSFKEKKFGDEWTPEGQSTQTFTTLYLDRLFMCYGSNFCRN
jgi:hypothetical protein